MCKEEDNLLYNHGKSRYPSDLSDEEWGLVRPLIPPAKRGGNKRTVDVREVVNGLMYFLTTGCGWRSIPNDLPPRSTLHDYFKRWAWDGTLERIRCALQLRFQDVGRRAPSPTGTDPARQDARSTRKGRYRSRSTVGARNRTLIPKGNAGPYARKDRQ